MPGRDLFDVPEEVAYFNTASLAPSLRSVRAAGEAALERASAPWQISTEDWFSEVERLRGLFGRLIGADPDGVALVPSSSYGLAVAAANLDAAPGQHVLVLDEEYPSGIYTWRAFARRTGAEIKTVCRQPGQGWTEAILSALDQSTAVVSIPNVHWTNGALIDLQAVAARAHDVGAALALDLSQSAGAIPVDVDQLEPDFLVAVGYKWLLGPFSLGYLYVAERHRGGEPLEHNWIVRKGAHDFARLADYTDELQEGARRFDMGERTNFILAPMAIAALEQIHDWSVDKLARELGTITGEIETAAMNRGMNAVSGEERGPHIIGIELPESKREQALNELRTRNIHAGPRSSWLRIAPHLHTTQENVERLFAAFDAVL